MRVLVADFEGLYRLYWHAKGASDPNGPLELTLGKIRGLATKFDRVAIATDSDTSRRKAISADYKAKRPPIDPVCAEGMKRTLAILANDGFPVWGCEGEEGDDILASFCEWAKRDASLQVTLLANDKDCNGCIRDGVKVMKCTGGEVLDEEAIFLKYGVTPAQWTSFQVLWGDPGDNVRGVDGVAEVTAAALLKAHKDIPGVLAAAMVEDRGDGKPLISKPALRANIIAAMGWLDQTRELVTLRLDCPCPFEQIYAERKPAGKAQPEGEDWVGGGNDEYDPADEEAAHSVNAGEDVRRPQQRENPIAPQRPQEQRREEPRREERSEPQQQRGRSMNQEPQQDFNDPRAARADNIKRIFRIKAKELAALFPENGMELVTRAQSTACSASFTIKNMQVSAESIAEAAIACHYLGLEVGDQAYIYDYGKVAKLTVGPRGLIALAYRSGFVKSIEARSVFLADYQGLNGGVFDYDFGTKRITHKKAMKDRRPNNARVEDIITHSYVMIETTTGGQIKEVLTAEDIGFYRSFSKAGSGPWFDNYEGMCRKTALKRGLEFVPRSPLLSAALRETEDGHFELPNELRAIVDKAIKARDAKGAGEPAKETPQKQEASGGEQEQVYANAGTSNQASQ